MLTEAWLADDFVALLNDQPVPYFRVNHAFKGVRVPGPGEYRIGITYRPRRLTLALALAAVGAAAAGIWWLLLARGTGHL